MKKKHMSSKSLQTMHNGNLFPVKTFVNFTISGQFTKIKLRKYTLSAGASLSIGVYNSQQRRQIRNNGHHRWMLPPSCWQDSICPTAASQTAT